MKSYASRDRVGVVVSLPGLWWSGSQFEKRHEASVRCVRVLKGLLTIGTLVGELNLSNNDLDDSFVDEFSTIIHESPLVTKIVLDKNRLTRIGISKLASCFRELPSTSRLSGVILQHNPVEDADASLKDVLAICPTIEFQIGPCWSLALASAALASKTTWWDYFFGPTQFMRAKMLELDV